MSGCPEGTYGPEPGYFSVSQCRKCDGGHYCSSKNSTAATGPCLEGYYCSSGNTSPRPSSLSGGQQQQQQRQQEPHHNISVQTRFASTLNLVCEILIYFGSTNDGCFVCLPPGRGGPCPAGHYCPQASVSPLPCARGTFSNLSKAVSQVTVPLRSLSPPSR